MARVSLNAHPRAYISYYLMASWLYYVHDIPLLSDALFDEICRFLVENLDSIEHEHKHLVSLDMLKAGTGYAIDFEALPTITRSAATTLANSHLGASLGPAMPRG